MFQFLFPSIYNNKKEIGGGWVDLLVGILVQISLQMSLICISFPFHTHDFLNKFD